MKASAAVGLQSEVVSESPLSNEAGDAAAEDAQRNEGG